MKVRADSLFARLKPKQREQLFEWLIIEGISLAEAKARCEVQLGQKTSLAALSNFYASHGFSWRVEQAKAAAAATGAKLPKDIDDQIAARVKQRQFELSLGQLSLKELKALAAMDLDERVVSLKEKVEPAKLAIAERRMAALESKMQQVREALEKSGEKGGLTEEALQKIREAAGML